MIRVRLGAFLALAVALGVLWHAPDASAAAEVHRLNLVISGIPGQIEGGDFNHFIDQENRQVLNPRGLQSLDQIRFGWTFDGELRYFMRPNFVLNAGVGQLKAQSKQEFLPAIGRDVNIRAEILSVPVHVGGAYYLAPYNQGDFRAQAYLGGGLLSLVVNKGTFEQVVTSVDSAGAFELGGTRKLVGRGDAPGYYAEAGVHMFFAVRYSVMIAAQYRSAVVRQFVDERTNQPMRDLSGRPMTLDVSGVGARMALAIGF